MPFTVLQCVNKDIIIIIIIITNSISKSYIVISGADDGIQALYN